MTEPRIRKTTVYCDCTTCPCHVPTGTRAKICSDCREGNHFFNNGKAWVRKDEILRG